VSALLTLVEGSRPGRTFNIRLGQRFVLGRTTREPIALEDPVISRRHLELELREGGLFVTDLGSTNGTRVESIDLAPGQPTRVPHGGSIALGSSVLSVQLDDGVDDLLEETRQFRLRDSPAVPETYQLGACLGRGASARVWAATHTPTGRKVAIKLLHLSVLEDSDEFARFMREADMAARIESPYAVRLLELNAERERPYIVMERVDGPSAQQILDSGPLSPAQVCRVGHDVARALEAAAGLGIVHRDVKPNNILLTSQGRAKLADFGLAKLLGSAGPTQTGQGGLGTLAYVAPEQAFDAKQATFESDLYALGATLYYLLSRRLPIPLGPSPQERSSVYDFLARLRKDPPIPIRRVLPDCPGPLAELLHGMLQKDPEARLRPAGRVAEAFAALLEEWGEPDPAEEPTDRVDLAEAQEEGDSTGRF